MTDQTTERLSRCYTGIVHDVMRARGLRDFTLPSSLRPLIPGSTLCGPVFTVAGRPATTDAHHTLVEWTTLLSKAKPGHVWISQPNDDVVAHMGELSAETLSGKGVLGCVIDGGIRDTGFIQKLGFPCWSRLPTPRDIVGYWLPTGFDVEITIGDVVIRPGDYVLADSDGVIRIPRDVAEEISREAVTSMETENKVRTAILDGEDPREAYLRYGKF